MGYTWPLGTLKAYIEASIEILEAHGAALSQFECVQGTSKPSPICKQSKQSNPTQIGAAIAPL